MSSERCFTVHPFNLERHAGDSSAGDSSAGDSTAGDSSAGDGTAEVFL